ncbi:MAG: hypothetical protein ISS69_04600 [Phycisphaerae bacterium]|nr:hypothetical protein [Phycisphaerae bacterium]
MRNIAIIVGVCAVAAAILTAVYWPKSQPLEPLKFKLPKAQFVGTPKNVTSENLEAARKHGPRPPLLVPPGLTNVARGKAVTSSDGEPIIGELSQATDGNAEAEEGSYVELGPGTQWLQIDLGENCEIYAIVVWHFHRQARIYRDVIVQISDDPAFAGDVQVVYNADHDNSSELGKGKDKEYFETNEGRLIPAHGARGRYVRLYSNGSMGGEMNHYIEVEVYGRVKDKTAAAR